MDANRIETFFDRIPFDQGGSPIRQRIECQDGFRFSVQGSRGHCISPCEDRLRHYAAYEIGFPSAEEPLIFEYAEDKNWTDTVYGYVPEEIINAVLAKHGGFKKSVAPKGVDIFTFPKNVA